MLDLLNIFFSGHQLNGASWLYWIQNTCFDFFSLSIDNENFLFHRNLSKLKTFARLKIESKRNSTMESISQTFLIEVDTVVSYSDTCTRIMWLHILIYGLLWIYEQNSKHFHRADKKSARNVHTQHILFLTFICV